MWPRSNAQFFPKGLESDIQRRNREDTNEGSEDHAAKHRRANVSACELGCTASDDKRIKAEYKSK